jgi:retron-type reverse transcriptase
VAQGYVREGQDCVVDIDITRFFDHVNHDILLRRIAQVLQDKKILRVIERYLRAGSVGEPYLNYHRPCGFATVEVGDNGRRRRR